MLMHIKYENHRTDFNIWCEYENIDKANTVGEQINEVLIYSDQ